MEHIFFFDGNSEKIAWTIYTNNSIIEQERKHSEIYLDKVTNQQSKYIALHVGIFWGIGRFIFKNDDAIKIMIDNKTMFDHLSGNEESSDDFIKMRTHFITQLIEKRKLKINYELISSGKYLALKL